MSFASGAGLFDYLAAGIADRGEGMLGVMLLRVQRFRQVNLLFADGLGAAVSRLASTVLRPEDTVLRIGECDFAVILPNMRNSHHAVLAAHRLVRGFVSRWKSMARRCRWR